MSFDPSLFMDFTLQGSLTNMNSSRLFGNVCTCVDCIVDPFAHKVYSLASDQY